LQTLPSPQLVPSVAFVWRQLPAVQLSVVHGLLSLHCPSVVHAAQPGIAAWLQPWLALQLSVVHAL